MNVYEKEYFLSPHAKKQMLAYLHAGYSMMKFTECNQQAVVEALGPNVQTVFIPLIKNNDRFYCQLESVREPVVFDHAPTVHYLMFYKSL